MDKKLLLIINPKAGRQKSRAPLYEAVAEFCRSGYLVYVHETSASGDATAYVQAHGSEYDLVVCYGGDGTLNETINGLLSLPECPAAGYLPAGSTNDFASSLGLSSDVLSAARAITHGTLYPVDVGCFNDRFFSYVASFGAFTKASYSAPQTMKNVLGHFAYVLEGVKDISTLHPYSAAITADGEVLDGKYLFCAVSNSTSIAGLMHLPDTLVSMNDGLLELLLVPVPNGAAELQTLLSALLAQDYTSKGMILRHVKEVTVRGGADLPWSLDGEYCSGTDLVNIRVLSRKLYLMR